MRIEQRDIVEFYVETLTSSPGPHPCIVISNQAVFEVEEYFYAVMLSTKQYDEAFEFEITPDMLTHQSDKVCYAKTQIIVQLTPDLITKRTGKIKKKHFNELLKHLNQEVFDYKPLSASYPNRLSKTG